MIITNKQCIVLLAIICCIVLFLSYEDAPLYAQEQTVVPVVTQTDMPKKIYPTIATPPQSNGKYEYLEITESCDFDGRGLCISAYAGPGIQYEKVYELEKGMLLKITSTEKKNGQTWYHVHFDEWLRYSDRVVKDWYIPAVAGRVVNADGEQVLTSSQQPTAKRIIVDLSNQMLYAYDSDSLFLTSKVSTGIDSSPTPLGTFTIYKKTPSRYMQGPIEGVTDVPFDLPGVPWNMYFTESGAVIHGAYWHDRYGSEQSDGCVNLPSELAKILYDWAPLGTIVTIQK